MKLNRFAKVGLAGFGISIFCCVTPALVALLAALGFSALTGYLDYLLLPAMVMFLSLIFYGIFMKEKKQCCEKKEVINNE